MIIYGRPIFSFNLKLIVLLRFTGQHPLAMQEGEWYPHHIASWMKYKDEDFFHYVFYEDIIQVNIRFPLILIS